MRCPARFYIIMGFCTFCILLALFVMLTPLLPAEELRILSPPGTEYYLRDCGGKVAVYDSPDPKAAPLAIHDIYVNLLPECDALRLKAGWRVLGDTALQRTLEDLGL